jgi:hypothetical protein
VLENILSYDCEILTVNYKLKKKLLSTEVYVLRRASITSKILNARDEVIREKMGITGTIVERLENITR